MALNRIIERAKAVFDTEIKGLRATKASLGASFADSVKAVLKASQAGGLVVVTGVGKSLIIAEKISAILSSTGTRSVVLNPVQAMHGDLGLVSSRDILLALSCSGESEEVLRLIPAIRRHGLKVIAMTAGKSSSLAAASDICLLTPFGVEACPFGMAPTTSATSMMAMGDALAMALLDARKFSIEDYAANHPAGAIGRAVVLKAEDIMRTGDALAVVSPKATVMETVLAMTKSKGGSAVVVDRSGKLAGIFTDGDFRRVLSKTTDCNRLLSTAVEKYSTKKPAFVYGDQFAAEVLRVFEKKRIDDLPVCDRSGMALGLIDIQDLPKMKVL